MKILGEIDSEKLLSIKKQWDKAVEKYKETNGDPKGRERNFMYYGMLLQIENMLRIFNLPPFYEEETLLDYLEK